MPQLRAYPAATYLEPTDALWIDRIGVGTMECPASLISPFSGALVVASGGVLYPGSWWAKTSLGALSASLPQLSTMSPADQIIVGDIDYNAGVNNFTVNAFAGDLIADHVGIGPSYPINISNTISIFVANATVAPYTIANQWRVVTYGM